MNPSALRILFFSHDFSLTGSPLLQARTVAALRTIRPAWTLGVAGIGKGPLLARYEAIPGITLASLDYGRPPFHFDAILSAVSAFAPDVVVLNGTNLYQELLLFRWLGLRTVWWVHDGIDVGRREGHAFLDPFVERMVSHAFPHADLSVFIARGMQAQHELFCPAIRGSATTILPGIDVESFAEAPRRLASRRDEFRRDLGLDTDDIVLLCVGTLEERKRQRVLLRIFTRWLDELDAALRARLRLIFVGGPVLQDANSSEYADALRAEVRSDLRGHVIFAGHQGNLTPFYVLADVHVLISTNEGLPIVNLEAMASGLLCLSSAVHGIPEQLEHEVSGYLVDPRDDESILLGLRRVLNVLLREPAVAARWRAEALKRLGARFALAAVTEEFAVQIEKLVAGLPVRAGAPPRTEAAFRALQRQVVLRWAVAKGDVPNEVHLVRGDVRSLAARSPRLGIAGVNPSGDPSSIALLLSSEARSPAARFFRSLMPGLVAAADKVLAIVAGEGAWSGDAIGHDSRVETERLAGDPGPARWRFFLEALTSRGISIVVAPAHGFGPEVLLARWIGLRVILLSEGPEVGFPESPLRATPLERVDRDAARLASARYALGGDHAPAAQEFAVLLKSVAAIPDFDLPALESRPSVLDELVRQMRIRWAMATADADSESAVVAAIAAAQEDVAALPASGFEWKATTAGTSATLAARATDGGDEPVADVRVLVLGDDLSLTGAPIVVLEFVAALRANRPGWVINVVAKMGGGLRARYVERVGLEPEVLLAATPPFHFGPLLEVVHRFAPDVVVLVGSGFLQESWILRWAGVRTMLWLHEGIDVRRRQGYPYLDPYMAWLAERGLRAAGLVLLPSFVVRAEHEKFCPSLCGRIEVIPVGLDVAPRVAAARELHKHREALRREHGIAGEDVVFLCAGTLEARKRQRELIGAFLAMSDRLPEEERRRCRLILVGGPVQGDAESEVYSADLRASIAPSERERILFTGHLPSTATYLAMADINVLVSTNECTPLVNLEAMLARVLVISSAVHGIPEDVKHGDTGFLVDPEDLDGVAALLAEVHALVRSADRRCETMRERACAHVVRCHATDRIANRMAASLEGLVRSPSPMPNRNLGDPNVRRFLQEEMVLRWAIAKGDLANELYFVRKPDTDRSGNSRESASLSGVVRTGAPRDAALMRVALLGALGDAEWIAMFREAARADLASEGVALAALPIGIGIDPVEILLALDAEDPHVVVVAGDSLAETVVLVRWSGRRTIWWRFPDRAAEGERPEGSNDAPLLQRAALLAHRIVRAAADAEGATALASEIRVLQSLPAEGRGGFGSAAEARATLAWRLSWHRALLASDVDAEAQILGASRKSPAGSAGVPPAFQRSSHGPQPPQSR